MNCVKKYLMKSIMNTPKKKVPSKCCNYIQWVAVFSVFVLVLQLGLYIGWASPNYSRLTSEESQIPASKSDISWIASLPSIASVSGAIFGCVFMEYMGTRRTLILAYLFMGVSWSCLLVANSIEWIYASRIIAAIPCVMMQGCFSMYLGEISSPEIRGTLISLANAGSPVGTVLSTVTETYLSMKISSSIYLAAALIGIILMLWLRDTPYFFTKKDDLECATRSVEFYYADKDTETELQGIKSFVAESQAQSLKDRILELRSPVNKRSMLAIFIIWGLPHLSGQGVLGAYMEMILKSAQLDLVKPQELVIYTTIVRAVVTLCFVKLIDKIGRKMLLIISCIGTSVSMFALGLHFYLLNVGFDGKSLQWLPIASIIMHSIAFAIGLSIVPGTVLSEMFSEKLKSTAVLLASISGPIFGFLVTKAYQPVVDFAGEEYAFWIHSLLSLFGIPCAVFLMIETKGKTFQEIQSDLIKKWHL